MDSESLRWQWLPDRFGEPEDELWIANPYQVSPAVSLPSPTALFLALLAFLGAVLICVRRLTPRPVATSDLIAAKDEKLWSSLAPLKEVLSSRDERISLLPSL